MRIINTQSLEKMNFSDFEVVDTILDKNTKSITFTINGAWYFDAGKRSQLGRGYLKILNYQSILITTYDANSDIERVLSEDNFEQFREINEIDIGQNNIVIKGFAQTTSNWLEFKIFGGIIKGEFLGFE